MPIDIVRLWLYNCIISITGLSGTADSIVFSYLYSAVGVFPIVNFSGGSLRSKLRSLNRFPSKACFRVLSIAGHYSLGVLHKWGHMSHYLWITMLEYEKSICADIESRRII